MKPVQKNKVDRQMRYKNFRKEELRDGTGKIRKCTDLRESK